MQRLTNIPILFLDCDGVLNGHERWPNGYCGLRQDCIENLNVLFEKIPEMRIVLSSAWRYMILGCDVSLKGFEYILLIAGANARGKLIGHTCSDEALAGRDKQIKTYIEHKHINQFVVVDDMSDEQLGGKVTNLVRTDPQQGLTLEKVQEIVDLFELQKG